MRNILGNKGLTSSEANHVTNIVKELTKDLSVANMQLKTSFIKEDGMDLRLDENERNENWVKNTLKVGELFALSAWLKSAIKFKENLLSEISDERFEKNLGQYVSQYKEEPELPSTTFEDYLNQLNTKQRNEYLTQEAKAAHIGKFVHNFDSIREESVNFIPTTFMNTNGTSLTVFHKRLYTKEELIEGFFELQKQHREAEKVVNLYKSRYRDWERQVLEDWNSEVKKVKAFNADLRIKVNQEQEQLRLDFENEKRNRMKVISGLKIIIPNELQSTLDYVNEYAK